MTATPPVAAPVAAYHVLHQPETLRTAWKLVRRGGPASGVDGRTLDQFAVSVDEELRAMAQELAARRYRFSPVRRALIPKPTGEQRRLGIPTVRDRVVEQALRLVLEPVLSPAFSIGSFAYRAGRGTQSALDAVLQHRHGGYAWIVQADIQDFFDMIDHQILLGALARANVDPEIRSLIACFLAAGVRFGRRWFPSRRGVCQGSPLSPLLANFYLDPFDHALQCAGYELVRYADDFLVFCTNRRQARDALEQIRRELARRKLALNPKKTRILDAWHQSFEFLGFLITPDGARPAESNIQRLRQTIAEQTDPGTRLSPTERIARLNPLIRSFRCYYQGCQVGDLFVELDAWIAKRLARCLPDAAVATSGADRIPARFGLARLSAAASCRARRRGAGPRSYHPRFR